MAAVLLALLVAACGGGADPAQEQSNDPTTTTTSAPSTTTTETTETTEPKEDPPAGGSVLTDEFSSLAEGQWRVESLGTPFDVEIDGDWSVLPNTDGFVVLGHPNSGGPGDRDVVFIRPTSLFDPAAPNAPNEELELWPVDDIEGWLDGIIDGLIVEPAVSTEVGGVEGIVFEVELADEELCGPQFCVGFVDNTDVSFKAFDPGFRDVVNWLDQGEHEPIAIIVGARTEDIDDWGPVAQSLLDTVTFGEPAPHPSG